MRIRLHPIKGLLTGLILFPWSEAGSVLQRYTDVAASAPDELSVIVGVLPGLGPAGAMALVLPVIVKLGPAAGLIMLAGIY